MIWRRLTLPRFGPTRRMARVRLQRTYGGREGLRLASVVAAGTGGVLVWDAYRHECGYPVKLHAISETGSGKQANENEVLQTVTLEQLAGHNSPEDCWVALDGKVYDVTSLLANHPGGSGILLAHGGQDVSEHFHWLQHSARAQEYLPGLYVANLSQKKGSELADKSSEAKEKVSVLVIGAGICGVAVAYHLSEAGYNVTVVEEGPMVGGTALKSSAILFLGPLLERDDSSADSSATAWTGDRAADTLLRIHREWEDIQFERRPLLGLLQTAEQRETASKLYGSGGRQHGQGQLLSAEEACALEPGLNPDIHGAVLSGGATCDPFLACNAFAKKAQALGAKFYFGASVGAIERRPGGGFIVRAVEVPPISPASPHNLGPHKHFIFETDKVLICVGWKANELAQALGHGPT